MFTPCEPTRYSTTLAIRFKNKTLREQYLNLDYKAIREEFIKEYGKCANCTPNRWYEIVSKYINLNPEE